MMRKLLLTSTVLAVVSWAALAQTPASVPLFGPGSGPVVTVTGGGDSLANAVASAQPGETIIVGSGTYTPVAVNTPDLTIQAAAGATPVVVVAQSASAGINIQANYTTIQGLTITGDAQSLTLAQASALGAAAATTANGINIGSVGGAIVSHTQIIGNTVANMPGGGIQSNYADYVTVLNNTVTGNANYSPYGESGISLYASQNSDNGTGTKNYVAGNTVNNNKELVIETATGQISDGEGIIIDDNSNNQTNGVQYTGLTLVSGNTVTGNGSEGIQVGNSSNVIVTGDNVCGNDVNINAGAGQIAAPNSTGVTLSGNVTSGSVTACSAAVTTPKPTTTSTAAQSTAPAASATIAPGASAVQAASNLPASLIPPGYLHTQGNQIVDVAGDPVRIASVGLFTTGGDLETTMQQIVLAGFNTLRIEWIDATLQSDLSTIDSVAAVAQQYGVRIILDHHADEGDGACGSQQKNGLWFDSGPGTNNTDGCGAAGTVTNAQFLQDWLTVARHYAGNSAVIGFDLDNEPLEIPGGSVVGGGGPTDIHQMWTTVGNALEAADPGALIIVEGPICWSCAGVNQDFDLTWVASNPVALNTPNHVVYSVHAYPGTIGGEQPDSGPARVAEMVSAWAYVETRNIAPVWVGEIGASLDGTSDSAGPGLPDEQAWAATIVPLLNGQDGALRGPAFSAGQQAMSTDWWAWGNLDGQQPDGTLDASGTLRPGQQAVYATFQQAPISSAYAASAPAPPALAPGAAEQQAMAQLTAAATLPSAASAAPTPAAEPAPAPASAATASPSAAATDPAANQGDVSQAQAGIAQAETDAATQTAQIQQTVDQLAARLQRLQALIQSGAAPPADALTPGAAQQPWETAQ
jgi:hypothetical protein